MLDVLLLHLELCVLVYIAVHQWQRYGLVRYSLLAVALVVMAFILLWALLSPLARLIFPIAQIPLWLSSDSVGLALTVGAHLAFVRLYFFRRRRPAFQPSTESQ